MLVNIMLTISGVLLKAIPIAIPVGVASENRKMNLNNLLNSILLFVIAILIDIDSANLWMKIERIRLIAEFRSVIRPRAIPSNIECTLKAIIRMNGVKLHFSLEGGATSISS